ncbi:MAG: hypothetical protein AB7O67_15215 [Vicinamibacterales bacterium]
MYARFSTWQVRHDGLAVVGLAALAVLHTFPLVLHLGTALPGFGLGDNVTYLWDLWWMRSALDVGRDFFSTDRLFAPLTVSLALHTHQALASAIGATLLAALPLVVAQNILLIATLALNGIATYALARWLGASRHGAFVAGGLVLMAPPVTLRLLGHFGLVTLWPLILGCWALAALVRSPSPWRAAALGAAVAATVYTDYYFSVYFAAFSVVYVVSTVVSARLAAGAPRAGWRWALAASGLAAVTAVALACWPGTGLNIGGVTISLRSGRNAATVAGLLGVVALWLRTNPVVKWQVRRGNPGPFVAAVALAGVMASVLLWPLLRHAATLVMAGDYITVTTPLKSSPGGIDLLTAVLGPPAGGVLGGAVRSWYRTLGIDVMEGSAWLGVLPPVLAWFGYRTDTAHRVESRRWLAVAVFFGVWALGPYLVVGGVTTGVLLPGALPHFLPLIDNARMPSRGLLVVALALGIMTGLAWEALWERRRTAWTVPVLVVAGLSLLAAPLPLTVLPESSAYRALAADPQEGAVLPVPFGFRDGFARTGGFDEATLYFQTWHGRPIAGGFLGRLPPRVGQWYAETQPFAALLAGGGATPSCEIALRGLRAAHVGFLVVDRLAVVESDRAVVNLLPVTLAWRDGRYDVMRLRPGADCPGS